MVCYQDHTCCHSTKGGTNKLSTGKKRSFTQQLAELILKSLGDVLKRSCKKMTKNDIAEFVDVQLIMGLSRLVEYSIVLASAPVISLYKHIDHYQLHGRVLPVGISGCLARVSKHGDI